MLVARFKPQKAINPYRVIVATMLLPMLLSLLAWLVPGSGLSTRGFEYRSEVTLKGIAVVALWIASLLFSTRLGYSLGGKIAFKPKHGDLEFSYKRGLLFLEIVACIGLAYAYLGYGDIDSILDAASYGQMNRVSEHLGAGAGVGTLRYASIILAPLSFILFRNKEVRASRLAFDFLLLFLQSNLSSRMSILIALVVIAVYYYLVRDSGDASVLEKILGTKMVTILVLIIVLVGLFAISSVLNYLRNSGFYASMNVNSSLEMNVFQILSYLGTPTQVALGIADNDYYISSISHVGKNPLNLLIPTFFTAKGEYVPLIYEGVSIAPNLTTNSVFAGILVEYGLTGLLAALFAYFFYAVLFRIFVEMKSLPGRLAAGASSYVFAEVWRVFLATSGITVFIILCALSLCVLRGKRPRGTEAYSIRNFKKSEQKGFSNSLVRIGGTDVSKVERPV